MAALSVPKPRECISGASVITTPRGCRWLAPAGCVFAVRLVVVVRGGVLGGPEPLPGQLQRMVLVAAAGAVIHPGV